MKRCPRCSLTKNLTEFGISRSKRDGLNTYCRPCARAVKLESKARKHKICRVGHCDGAGDGSGHCPIHQHLKTCDRCSQTKPLDEFNIYRRMRDGRSSYCRDCSRELTEEWRVNHPEKTRESNRAPNYKPHPMKLRARYDMRNGVRHGKLIRPSVCSRCSKECHPDAHHPDYSQPLEVVWLCRSCHVLVERELRREVTL